MGCRAQSDAKRTESPAGVRTSTEAGSLWPLAVVIDGLPWAPAAARRYNSSEDDSSMRSGSVFQTSDVST